MVVAVGLTVKALPVPIDAVFPCTNQLTVPVQPEAVKSVDDALQMVVASGVIVGAAGVGFTVTI